MAKITRMEPPDVAREFMTPPVVAVEAPAEAVGRRGAEYSEVRRGAGSSIDIARDLTNVIRGGPAQTSKPAAPTPAPAEIDLDSLYRNGAGCP